MSKRKSIHRGLTLIELLVVTAVVAMLMAILLPAFSGGRHAARDLRCRAQLRNITLKFTDFASESSLHGDSETLGEKKFRLEDFQESIYKVSEFWDGPEGVQRMNIEPADQPLMCPSATGQLY